MLIEIKQKNIKIRHYNVMGKSKSLKSQAQKISSKFLLVL